MEDYTDLLPHTVLFRLSKNIPNAVVFIQEVRQDGNSNQSQH